MPAFTLPEMVVTLFLTGILFMTALTVYMITNSQSKLVLDRNNFYADYFITKKALKNDFTQPGPVTISEDKRSMTIVPQHPTDNTPQKITYLFDSSYIVRSAGEITDTLLPGAEIVDIGFARDSVPLVNFIRLRSSYKGKSFFTYLQKNYAAEELLSFENTIEQ
ncbi:MAG: prepilin-type N-terminal cleavage/methylation domain-containing protein [Niabella sp.]